MATVLRLNPGHAGLLQLDERVGEDADDEDEKDDEDENKDEEEDKDEDE